MRSMKMISPRRASCRAHSLSISYDGNFREFGATERSRNLNRWSNIFITRLTCFGLAGCNRSSTEPGLSFIQILAARRLHPRRSGFSLKSARAIPIWNTILQQVIADIAARTSRTRMRCFVESPSAAAIAALARKKRVPLVEDLGSGAVVPTEQFGIAEHEPTPLEALKAGADLVCFSGDKLFGGPQAGIIVGKKRFIA